MLPEEELRCGWGGGGSVQRSASVKGPAQRRRRRQRSRCRHGARLRQRGSHLLRVHQLFIGRVCNLRAELGGLQQVQKVECVWVAAASEGRRRGCLGEAAGRPSKQSAGGQLHRRRAAAAAAAAAGAHMTKRAYCGCCQYSRYLRYSRKASSSKYRFCASPAAQRECHPGVGLLGGGRRHPTACAFPSCTHSRLKQAHS